MHELDASAGTERGGGLLDRTLAALPRKPQMLGVGYGLQANPSIYAQPHDIPMDRIITEAITI